MKKSIFLLALVIPTIVNANNVFVCNTAKHTIHINQLDSITYQYNSWNKPKSIKDKPDMDITQKNVLSVEGTGVCRYSMYTFKKGDVVFEITDGLGCTEETPPNNATGSLNVYIKEELKSHYWCTKQ